MYVQFLFLCSALPSTQRPLFLSPKTEAFEYALLMGAMGSFFTIHAYGKLGNKNMKHILQHDCKTTWIAMSRESSSTFCNKICTCCAFYTGPRETWMFCSKWRNARVWHNSRVILSNQKLVFTQLATSWFVTRQVWAWVSKTRNIAFQLVLQQCWKTSCTLFCPSWRNVAFQY